MRNGRLGCLSWSGLLAMLITLLAIGGVVYARGGFLYSPGPLNAQQGEVLGGIASHAELEGQCDACHSAPWSRVTMADLCVSCHGEIASQMQTMVALHGSMYQDNPTLECRDCHKEHRGADAPLTVLQGAEFPHELLGYSLEGHRFTVQNEAFSCNDCHGDDISTFAPDTCDACHRQMDAAFTQAHVQSYGMACLDCHDGVDSLGKNFSHAAFEFKLTGKHQEADCATCHTDARSLADFQAAPQDCYSCHGKDDQHRGRFGADCAACHSPTGWEPANFDHNLSGFRLEGEHDEAACEDCHQNGVYQGTPTDCYSCHQKDDEHNGRFGTDCAACHSPNGWEPANFDHNRSNFPLDGAHVQVACEQCHVDNTFAGLPTECVACHTDPDFHLGAFGTTCQDCHNTSTWSPARFNILHPEPRVGEGGNGINHGGTTCRGCHPATVQTYTCLECHSDNQGGEGEEHEGGGDD